MISNIVNQACTKKRNPGEAKRSWRSAGVLAGIWRSWRTACLTLAALSLGMTATAQTATTSTLTVSPSSSIAGQNVSLNAVVMGDGPSGTVNFKDGTTVLGTATLSAGDRWWSNVVLLLHFDASEGSHVFKDYSTYQHTHAASILNRDTGLYKYGTGAGLWNGVDQLLQYPLTNEFLFGSGDFTIETWANFSNSGDRVAYYSDCAADGGGGQVYLLRDTSDRNRAIVIDTTGTQYAITGSVIPANAWVHIAVSRSGNTLRLFLNGALDGSVTLPAGAVLQTPSGHPSVGRGGDYAGYYGGTYGMSMMGRLDDFRITKGVARYVASFTPPSASFTNRAESLASFASSSLAPGSHSLSVSYGGDDNNAPSLSSVVIASVQGQSSPTTLSVSPNPAAWGQSVTLSATVTGNSPSGSVVFKDAGNTLATTPLNAGQASFSTSALAVGVHSLSASYEGDTANPAGTSDSVLLQVTASAAIQLPAPPLSPTPVTRYEYDAEGNPTKTIVAPATLAYATKHEYDALGRHKNTTDAKNGLTQFGYDLLDQLTSVTDPRQLATQYQPNGLGDVKAVISPDTGTTSNTSFDAAGNLKASTDARGVQASLDYDELNRLKQAVYSKSGAPNRTFNWTYDQTGASFGYGVGRLTTAASPDASTTFRYDELGRVKMTVQSSAAGAPLVVNYDYDDAGHVTALTYPSGRVVAFGWANGQPQSIGITSGTGTKLLLNQITMSAFGPVKSWVWQLGSTPRTHERVFDTSGRLVRHPLGDLVRDIRYDDANRISSYTHYAATTGQPAPAYDQSFNYDEMDRLRTATGSTNWSYDYDANGNRTASSAGATQRSYVVQATSNRLDALSNPARSMLYDAAGNTSSDIQSSASSNYTAAYSLEGRLAAMAQGSSAGVDFGYDALGRRVTRGQWTGSAGAARAFTLYAYDQASHLIGEYAADGTPLTEYVWLGDTPVAVIKPDGAGMQVYAIHTDHLDTPRMILDAGGQVRWRWLGEPFGASPADEQPTPGLAALQQNLRFSGQQYEPFGGRHYNHFRDYDPTIGRYVQSDPIGLDGGINTYAYVLGNPLSLADPEGLNPAAVCRAFSIGYRVGEEIVEPAVRSYVTAGVEWAFGDPLLAAKPVQSSAPHDAANRRQRQYEAAKARCTPPNPEPEASCADLSKMVDMLKNSVDRYTYFDAKYSPGRHAAKIAEIQNRIDSLKERYNKNCTDCK